LQQISIVIQVNGQKKSIIYLDSNQSQSKIENLAKNDLKIKKIIGERKISKIIFVKNKLINLVIK